MEKRRLPRSCTKAIASPRWRGRLYLWAPRLSGRFNCRDTLQLAELGYHRPVRANGGWPGRLGRCLALYCDGTSVSGRAPHRVHLRLSDRARNPGSRGSGRFRPVPRRRGSVNHRIGPCFCFPTPADGSAGQAMAGRFVLNACAVRIFGFCFVIQRHFR